MVKYRIDLNEQPDKRWCQLINDYKLYILEIVKSYSHFSSLSPLIELVVVSANKAGLIMYGDELAAIAKQLGVSEAIVIILQFIYEMNACCTSVISVKEADRAHKKRILHHFRTMDWEMPILKKITVNVEVYRGEQYLFDAITWAGYVGILTGMCNDWSIAVNFRQSQNGSLSENLQNACGGAWPIGYLVRHLLSSNISFSKAVENLNSAKLISPTYFSICGHHEARVIERNSQKVIKARKMIAGTFLIQTNIDYRDLVDSKEEGILKSRTRYSAAMKYLRSLSKEAISTKELKHLAKIKPVVNDITVYAVYMCAASKEITLIYY